MASLQRFNHRGNQEIAADLHNVRHLRLLTHHKETLTDCFQHRLTPLDDGRRSSGNDKQLAGLCCFGSAKNRCCNVILPRVGRDPALAAGERHADGAGRDVNRAPRQGFDEPLRSGRLLTRRARSSRQHSDCHFRISCAASAGDVADFAPRASSSFAFDAVRFHTVSSCPAFSRWCAI